MYAPTIPSYIKIGFRHNIQYYNLDFVSCHSVFFRSIIFFFKDLFEREKESARQQATTGEGAVKSGKNLKQTPSGAQSLRPGSISQS